MKKIKTVDEFLSWRSHQSDAIGFILTLGALHKGHLSLIKQSKQRCQLTIVSIFLNPTQFSPDEDLDSYPKTLGQDSAALQKLGVDILFLPTENEMYQQADDVQVPHTLLFNKLEGKSRPHFFTGVTAVVAKLFDIIKPSHAFFGEKDAQQLYIIQQMIKNMQYPIILVPCQTIRDKNGLAFSSRNQYLKPNEQQRAGIIYQGLMHIKEQLDSGETAPLILKELFTKMIDTIPEMKIDYISIACVQTLDEIESITNKKILVSTAVFFKGVRLIDNFTYSSSAT